MSWDWNDARKCDALAYDLVLGDYPRGQNRALIQSLANGAPPYTDAEVQENNIAVNVSDLSHTRLLHDARSQFYNSFLKTGFFASATTDAGPVHKRRERGVIVSRAWNRYLKRSIQYYERLRAEFGMLVLHGISPAVWENKHSWCPQPIGIEDVLIPSQTLLGFKNLPFLVIRRQFTGMELQKLTRATKRDPGWNMPMVQKCIDWLAREMVELRTNGWPEVWSPEKMGENAKEDGGFFVGDSAPALSFFDIYAYVDDGEESGWIRRIILDSWNDPSNAGGSVRMDRDTKGVEGGKPSADGFIFSSKEKYVAGRWEEIAAFQFADLSAVFPARYHSTRSLGWMTYASCHMGNRLRCKFYESVLETLMQLYRVKSADDVANALKLNLINHGFIDETINPVPAGERWQPNAGLIELGLKDSAQVTGENSAAWRQQPNYSGGGTEKTRFQVMAEMQAMTQLVSAALNQAYMYQAFEYREIFRRFCIPKSRDPDVRAFQAECFRQGVPAKYLHDHTVWDIEPERVMGSGNKTMEMQIAGQLMEWRDKFDPEPQRAILRDVVLAITDDPARAEELVPEVPVKVTDSTHDAELVAATLMQGIPVQVMTGINHIETIETLIKILAGKVQAGLKQGGMVDQKELAGMFAIAQHISEHIKIIAEDPQEKQRVKRYGDLVGKLENQLKAFAQRLQEAMKKQQEAAAKNNGGPDPKDAAKIQAMQMTAQVKAKNARESHAQKTAQRQIEFEQRIQQQQEQHHAELTKKDLEAAGTIRRGRLTGLEE